MWRADSFEKTLMLGKLKAGEGDDRGWNVWMASQTQWTWVWINSGSWWWTGRPGVLRSKASQRVGHDWVTELNWTEPPTNHWLSWGLSSGSDGKESDCNAGDPGLISVGKIPWRKEWLPTLVFLPGEFHRQKSSAHYCPWGSKELDMTERLSHAHTPSLGNYKLFSMSVCLCLFCK